MGRIEWLKWIMRYGNPKTRARSIGLFVAFEAYNFGCALNGYRTAHWLEQKPSRPAGRYLRLVRPAPFLVWLLDRMFYFGEEAHCDYLPYTPETAAEMARDGKRAKIVDISYTLQCQEL